MADPADTQTIHATTVAVNGDGILIRGAAGSGKSGLALQLISLGATLVADDRTIVWRDGDRVMADAPDPIRGQIEARYVGILPVAATGPVRLTLVIDMDRTESERLPPLRNVTFLGITLPLFRKVTLPHFPSAIMVYVSGGRIA